MTEAFSAVVLSCFTLSRHTNFTEVSRIQPEDPPILSFKAIVYSRSWVRKLVNRPTQWETVIVANAACYCRLTCAKWSQKKSAGGDGNLTPLGEEGTELYLTLGCHHQNGFYAVHGKRY